VTGPFAYLDPGSGSMMLQLLLGGFAGIAVLIKMYGRRLGAALGWRREASADEGVGAGAGSERQSPPPR
jgi:hypothetical protein